MRRSGGGGRSGGRSGGRGSGSGGSGIDLDLDPSADPEIAKAAQTALGPAQGNAAAAYATPLELQCTLLTPLKALLMQSPHLATRQRTLQAVLNILGASGHVLRNGWTEILEMVQFPADQARGMAGPNPGTAGVTGGDEDAGTELVPLAFKSVGLIANDFLTYLPLVPLTHFILCLGGYADQRQDINTSLTAINLFSSVADYIEQRLIDAGVAGAAGDAALAAGKAPMRRRSSGGADSGAPAIPASSFREGADALWSCLFCELRRCDWFDLTKCAGAKRRNLHRSYLQSHLLPPGSPPDARYTCPCCKQEVSAESQAQETAAYAAMSEGKRTEKERLHRNEHVGELYLLGKILYSDHKDRMLSLLHAILNSVASTLSITMAAGASKAQREKLNAVLAHFTCYYRFRDKPGARGKKTCRK